MTFVLIAAAVLYLAIGAVLAFAWTVALWTCELEWPRLSEVAVIVLAWPVPAARLIRDASFDNAQDERR